MGFLARILGLDQREPIEHPTFGRLHPSAEGWEGEIDFEVHGHATGHADLVFEGKEAAGPTPTQVAGLTAFLTDYAGLWETIRGELEGMVDSEFEPWVHEDRRLDFHAPSISVRPAPPSESPIISLQYNRNVGDEDYNGYFVDLCDGVVVDTCVVD